MMFAYLSGGRGAIVMTNGDRGGALADEIVGSIAIEYGWPDFKPHEKSDRAGRRRNIALLRRGVPFPERTDSNYHRRERPPPGQAPTKRHP